MSDQQSRPTQNPSLLTPSPTLAEGPPPLATGNEWVALPAIDGATGGVRTMEVLSMRALGSLGVAGSPDPWAAPGHSGGPAAGGESPGSASEPPPLLRPFLRVGDEAVALGEAPVQVAWLADWVPRLAWEAEGLRLEATYCAPIGHRGWALQLAVTNGRPSAVEVAVGVEGRWASLVYSLFRSRPMPVTRTCQPDPWTGSLALEAAAGWPVLGWAIGAAEAAPILEVPPSADSVQFTLGRSLTLAPGATEAATFFVGVAPELDGARTTVVDLRRRGWDRLLEETLAWLERRRQVLGDEALEEVVNRNLFFSHFFACGRTIDTEAWVAVTSRSPRYYVSAAYWARDTLLWSLPGLLLVEPATAREVLRFAFRSGWKHPGMHAQYITGAVLYPGFELDELAAYPVALGRYLEATGDGTLLDEPEVRAALRAFPAVLEELAGPGPLYPTFLDPSDDPPPYPYLTYANALLWRGLRELEAIYDRLGDAPLATWAQETAARLHQAIQATCVVDGPFGPMFAWAVDGQGAFTLYDNPPGSLQLLGTLGLCPPDDPVLVNTIRWVHSRENPYWYPGPFGEAGSSHAPNPWPLAAANTLLAAGAPPELKGHALNLLRKAPLDGGFVCETIDPETGRARSGAAFATAAGYVAAALVHAWRAGMAPPR